MIARTTAVPTTYTSLNLNLIPIALTARDDVNPFGLTNPVDEFNTDVDLSELVILTRKITNFSIH